jgi:hypothetical protein
VLGSLVALSILGCRIAWAQNSVGSSSADPPVAVPAHSAPDIYAQDARGVMTAAFQADFRATLCRNLAEAHVQSAGCAAAHA